MKTTNKIVSLITLVLLFAFVTSCGPSKKDALNANDDVVGVTNKLSKSEEKFFKVCKTYVKTDIDNQTTVFLDLIKKSKEELTNLDLHEKLNPIKDAGLELVTAYAKTEADYKEYARLYSIPDSSFTKEDNENSKKAGDRIDSIVGPAFEKFLAFQKAYAQQHGFKLRKNDFLKNFDLNKK